MLKTYCHCL